MTANSTCEAEQARGEGRFELTALPQMASDGRDAGFASRWNITRSSSGGKALFAPYIGTHAPPPLLKGMYVYSSATAPG